jgi:membrane-anchored mycosin MYCP
MSVARRTLVVLLTAVMLVSSPMAARADDYVKFYRVTASYQGAPETLTEIAARFLGGDARASEIFNLNSGRAQADGQTLADPNRLNPGWVLVMPWDAVGVDIQYGVPGGSGPATGAPTAPGRTPAPPPTHSSPVPVKPGGARSAVAGGCARPTTPVTMSKLVKPGAAWPMSRGRGQLVAVVDSGSLAGSVPDLAVGVDVTGGHDGGDVDCLGTGTAMARIVAGRDGMAPDASVLPIRIAATKPAAAVADQVKAFRLAVIAGATVIAVGDYVDPDDAQVSAAIGEALAKNIVVVDRSGAAAARPGLLRVAEVAGARSAPPANADVTAPGVDEHNPAGRPRRGAHDAVAYSAGEAALVRSAFPELTAAQVAHRVAATASSKRFIDPEAAVTRILPEEEVSRPLESNQSLGRPWSAQGWLLGTAVLAMLVFASLFGLHLRRLADDDRPAPPPTSRESPDPAAPPEAASPEGEGPLDPLAAGPSAEPSGCANT